MSRHYEITLLLLLLLLPLTWTADLSAVLVTCYSSSTASAASFLGHRVINGFSLSTFDSKTFNSQLFGLNPGGLWMCTLEANYSSPIYDALIQFQTVCGCCDDVCTLSVNGTSRLSGTQTQTMTIPLYIPANSTLKIVASIRNPISGDASIKINMREAPCLNETFRFFPSTFIYPVDRITYSRISNFIIDSSFAVHDVNLASKLALQRLYSATRPWSTSYGWKENNEGPLTFNFCCEWAGVECSFFEPDGITVTAQVRKITPYATTWPDIATIPTSAAVTRLVLRGYTLQGSLVSDIDSLLSLRYIDIAYNSLLSGSLPSNFAFFTNLTYIDISATSIALRMLPAILPLKTLIANRMLAASGSIDSSIGGLANLFKLEMFETKLSSFPINFGQLNQLNNLNVDTTTLTSLNTELCGCVNLVTLTANWNEITSVDPCFFTSLTKLQSFSVRNNKMAWSLGPSVASPVSIPGNLSSMSFVYLDNSKLVDLGTAFTNSFKLTVFLVTGNSLSSLSSSWNTGIPRPLLTVLDLSYNNFVNPISSQILNRSNFPNLQTVILSFNPLLIDLGTFWDLPLLTSIRANNCSLIRVPLLGNLPSLTMLDLAYNAITSIPFSLADPPVLATINLAYNRISTFEDGSEVSAGFTGRFYQGLLTLSLSNNFLSTLPWTLSNATLISVIDVSSNRIQSNLLPTRFFSTRVLTLRFSDNANFDFFPTLFSNLSSTITLECSRCGLRRISTSIIGTSVCGMASLQNLVLSYNSIDDLPNCVANMTRLRTLDLSFNALTTLSSSIIFGKNSSIIPFPQLVTLRLSGNMLQMDAIDQLTTLPILANLYLDKNHLFGTLPPSLTNFSRLSILDLSNNRILTLPVIPENRILTVSSTGLISPSNVSTLSELFLLPGANNISAFPTFFPKLSTSLTSLLLNGNMLHGAINGDLLHLNQPFSIWPFSIRGRGLSFDCPINASGIAGCVSSGKCTFSVCFSPLPTSVSPVALSTLNENAIFIKGVGLTRNLVCEFFTAAAAASGTGGIIGTYAVYVASTGIIECGTPPRAGLLGPVVLRLRDVSLSTPSFISSNGGYPAWSRPLPTLYFVDGCPPGTFLDDSTQSCLSCRLGFYQPFFNQTTCLVCPKGTEAPLIGSTSCSACPIKYYAGLTATPNCNRCLPGTFGNVTGLSSCYPCPLGTFSPDPDNPLDACLPCPVGTYGDKIGLAQCPACSGASFTGVEGSTSCISCPENARVLLLGAKYVTDCICNEGYYGQPGGPCFECPPGGRCPGNGERWPLTAPGYWVDETGDPSSFFLCQPAEACLGYTPAGNATCSLGYAGRVCGACLPLQYYRLQSRCVKCPADSALLWIALFAVAFGAVLMIIINAKPGDFKLFSVSIALTYVQMLALFHNFEVGWPRLVISTFDAASVTNLNIELFSPECSVKLTFWTKWVLKMAVPAVLFVIFATYFFAVPLYKRCKRSLMAGVNKLKKTELYKIWFLNSMAGRASSVIFKALQVIADAIVFVFSWILFIFASPFFFTYLALRILSAWLFRFFVIYLLWDKCLLQVALRWRAARARSTIHARIRKAQYALFNPPPPPRSNREQRPSYLSRLLKFLLSRLSWQGCITSRAGRRFETFLLFCCNRALPMDYHTEEEYANVEKEGGVSVPMIKINPIDISSTNSTLQVLASSSSSLSSSSLSRPLSSNTFRLKLLTEIKSAHKTLNLIDKTEERVRDASLSASWFKTTTPSIAKTTTTMTRASASVPMHPFQSTTTDSMSSETSVSIFNPMMSSNLNHMTSTASSSSTTLPLQHKKIFESFVSSRELIKRKSISSLSGGSGTVGSFGVNGLLETSSYNSKSDISRLSRFAVSTRRFDAPPVTSSGFSTPRSLDSRVTEEEEEENDEEEDWDETESEKNKSNKIDNNDDDDDDWIDIDDEDENEDEKKNKSDDHHSSFSSLPTSSVAASQISNLMAAATAQADAMVRAASPNDSLTTTITTQHHHNPNHVASGHDGSTAPVDKSKFKMAFLKRASYRFKSPGVEKSIVHSGLGGAGVANRVMQLPLESGVTFQASKGKRVRTFTINSRRRLAGLTGTVLVTEPEKKREIGFGLLPTRVLKQLRDLQILDDISVWSSSETETQEQKQHLSLAVTQKRSLSMPPPSTLSLSSSSSSSSTTSSFDTSASIPTNSSTSLSTTTSPTLSRHSTRVGGKMLFRPKSMMIRSTSLERANRTKHAAQILQQHNSHSHESSSSLHTNSASSDGTSLSNHHHINPLRMKRNRSFREVAMPNRPGFVTVQISDGSRIEIASWKFGLLPRNAIEVSLVKRYEVHEELTDRFIYAATNLATLAYTFLASTALEPLNCIPQPDGTYLLKTAADIKCYDPDYNGYLVLVVAAISTYVIGIPLVLFWILYYYQKRGLIATPQFDYLYGSLTLPFTKNMWYFELVNTLRKLGIVIVVQYLGRDGTPDSTLSQLMVAMSLFSAFALLQVYESPYKWVGNGTLSLFTTLSLLFTLFSGLLFFTQRLSKLSIYYVSLTTIGMIGFSFAAIVYTLQAEMKRAKQKSDVSRALGLNRYQVFAMEQRLLENMFPHSGDILVRELYRLNEDERDAFVADCFQLLRLMPNESGGLDPYATLKAAQAASLSSSHGVDDSSNANNEMIRPHSVLAAGLRARPLKGRTLDTKFNSHVGVDTGTSPPLLPPPNSPPPPLPPPPPLSEVVPTVRTKMQMLWTGRMVELVKMHERDN
jgi:Leucine-rich repeat (LRR) protein